MLWPEPEDRYEVLGLIAALDPYREPAAANLQHVRVCSANVTRLRDE